MEIIRVEYEVQPEYAEQNKTNIKKVMDALREKNVSGFKYFSQISEDGVSFMHISMKQDSESESPLNEMQEFNDFRMALKASNPVSPPKSTKFDLVGSGHDFF